MTSSSPPPARVVEVEAVVVAALQAAPSLTAVPRRAATAAARVALLARRVGLVRRAPPVKRVLLAMPVPIRMAATAVRLRTTDELIQRLRSGSVCKTEPARGSVPPEYRRVDSSGSWEVPQEIRSALSSALRILHSIAEQLVSRRTARCPASAIDSVPLYADGCVP